MVGFGVLIVDVAAGVCAFLRYELEEREEEEETDDGDGDEGGGEDPGWEVGAGHFFLENLVCRDFGGVHSCVERVRGKGRGLGGKKLGKSRRDIYLSLIHI